MQVKSVELHNFGSYKHLKFEFNGRGLTLIEGATGSGKSTLCDAIPWILFGSTSKGGSVDEVCQWNSNGATQGTVRLACGLTVYRSRNPNDLSYSNNVDYDTLGDSTRLRGKDVRDTQNLINQKLGFDYETYLSAAYFHEFSQTAEFFTTSAKNRRVITEQLADLSLATNLQESTILPLKAAKQTLVKLEAIISKNKSQLGYALVQRNDEQRRAASWHIDQDKRRDELLQLNAKFDVAQAQRIESLLHKQEQYMSQARNLTTCSECGAPKKANHIHNITDPYQGQIDIVLTSKNTYLEQIERLNKETNPFNKSTDDTDLKLARLYEEDTALNRAAGEVNTEVLDLEFLQNSLQNHRNQVLSNNIAQLQDKTNELITKHFDGEIRVAFTAEGADKLEVLITKDGNEAAYTQLSKGQRQILKLSFAVAVMGAISNQKGVHFDQLFFDESLSGLDESMKAKAFSLLESLSLSHSDVFVVEHSEGMKQLFSSTISVSLENGNSTLCQN